MIDFPADINEDLEKTQRLPVLSADVQLDEAFQRERAARIEIAELMRQNLRQAKEIEQLRGKHIDALLPHPQRFAPAIERQFTTEERLFEVCGALKDTLSKVLRECRTRSLALHCGSAARRALEDSCDKLEQILSAPGFHAPTADRADMAQKFPLAKASQTAELAFRSIPVMPDLRLVPADVSRPARVPRLEVLSSEAKP
jgi:hypothetical protein